VNCFTIRRPVQCIAVSSGELLLISQQTAPSLSVFECLSEMSLCLCGIYRDFEFFTFSPLQKADNGQKLVFAIVRYRFEIMHALYVSCNIRISIGVHFCVTNCTRNYCLSE